MTWEELEQLPDEIAGEIELWDGRVVWVRKGPPEHQDYSATLWSALRRCAREGMSAAPDHCWRVSIETNIFFGSTGKSDFVTPDFLVYRCLEREYQNVRASDVLIAGEVLSPSNSEQDIEAKKAKYASGGIPWYWEVTLGRNPRRIARVRAFALETEHGPLPDGVAPLRPANYLLAGEWLGDVHDGIDFAHPFPIHIPWNELEF
ncbi:Uma2 family endonuclease [Nocardia yunnanensis]|uniref:Uma2 family endonuclease n=1 Tax=Nocardia yunnanensis TaxID=2382165 RepID=A0A386ZQ37_9NOCA|nr:Uma2 family endonuclease [Nocardia yunnanensis]AYF79483.1 Uma2 family endonuclease [Nocardia yunnanensis]